MSPYAYANDRSTALVDPSGLCSEPAQSARRGQWAAYDASSSNIGDDSSVSPSGLVGPLRSCRAATFDGPDGIVHVQTDKATNRLSFSVSMFDKMWYTGAVFTWTAFLGFDKIGGDTKPYPPHASWPRNVLRTGAVFSLRVTGAKVDTVLFFFRRVRTTHSVPVKCVYFPW